MMNKPGFNINDIIISQGKMGGNILVTWKRGNYTSNTETRAQSEMRN